MSDLILFALGLFPISFFAFVMSERLSATHQARVGRAITLGGFFRQHWADLIADLKSIPTVRVWLLYGAQLSLIFLLSLNWSGGFFLYLIFNFFLVVLTTHDQLEVFERISSDRSQMRFLIGAFLSFLSLFGCFLASGTFQLYELTWSWTHLLFLVPFQLSGMILFGEHPFSSIYTQIYWLKSARFFLWSLLGAQIFLGTNWFGLDLYAKAGALYLISRLAGQYFPKYGQTDLFKLALVYYIPITVLLFLVTAVIYV